MTGNSATADPRRGLKLPQVVGWTGVVAAAVGYLLEAFRQRGDCDAGDMVPDTLPVSIALIVLGGGLLGIIAAVATVVAAIRRRWSLRATIRVGLPASVALAGFIALLLLAGRGPSTWFQYCAT